MRLHEELGAVVLEAAVRSWPPIAPRVLRWEFPLWKTAWELDPTALRSEKPKRKAPAPEPDLALDGQVWEFVERLASDTPQTRTAILQAANAAGLSGRQAQQLIRSAVDLELLFWWGGGRYRPSLHATQPRSNLRDDDEVET